VGGAGTFEIVPKDVVGAVEIARMLGVSRARVGQLSRDDPRFPKPWRTLAQGRLWDLRAIERWAVLTGRTLKPMSN
jgi:predicted DNA-binding transcriptional regulator AlpA